MLIAWWRVLLMLQRRGHVTASEVATELEVPQRIVDPWGLAQRAGHWYLIAGTVRGQRTWYGRRPWPES